MRDGAYHRDSYETGEQEIENHLPNPERFALIDFVEKVRCSPYSGERSVRKHIGGLLYKFPFWHLVKNYG